MEGDSHGEMSNGDVLCSVSGALWLSRLNGPVEGGPLSFGEINIAREGSGVSPGERGGGCLREEACLLPQYIRT